MIGQYVTVHGDVISHVNITHVMVEDGGEYSCIAENRAGKVSHSARLNIYGTRAILWAMCFVGCARGMRVLGTAGTEARARFVSHLHDLGWKIERKRVAIRRPQREHCWDESAG